MHRKLVALYVTRTCGAYLLYDGIISHSEYPCVVYSHGVVSDERSIQCELVHPCGCTVRDQNEIVLQIYKTSSPFACSCLCITHVQTIQEPHAAFCDTCFKHDLFCVNVDIDVDDCVLTSALCCSKWVPGLYQQTHDNSFPGFHQTIMGYCALIRCKVIERNLIGL